MVLVELATVLMMTHAVRVYLQLLIVRGRVLYSKVLCWLELDRVTLIIESFIDLELEVFSWHFGDHGIDGEVVG